MAQVPATSKARRALIRTCTAVCGAGIALDHLALQPSERAALGRRRAGRLLPPTAPEVVFLIPLVGRHHVGDWAAVEARLAATLASFRAQTSDRWRAVICSQEAPGGLDADPRLSFLPFTRPFEGNDKWAKLDQLCRQLPGLGLGSGYAMPFDADDLLNRHAVEEMVSRAHPNGYLVTRGLVRDARTGGIGRCAPQSLAAPGRKAFWKMCGSCAAFRFDLGQGIGEADFLAHATSHEHRMFPYLAGLAGRPLAPLDQEAAMYVVNHGENFGIRRGRVGFKTRYVSRFPVTDPAELARIADDFPAA